MDTMSAFRMGQLNKGNPLRVFDWITAAKLIRERQASTASAGLADDWDWTGGRIYIDGAPVPAEDTYTYLASTWAIPELMLDYEVMECWVWQGETGWTAETYWPDEALAVLRGEAVS
jgi:hypothetical protein